MLPEKLDELIKTAKSGYDFVTVSRYKKPAISYDDSVITKFGNHLFTKLVIFLEEIIQMFLERIKL